MNNPLAFVDPDGRQSESVYVCPDCVYRGSTDADVGDGLNRRIMEMIWAQEGAAAEAQLLAGRRWLDLLLGAFSDVVDVFTGTAAAGGVDGRDWTKEPTLNPYVLTGVGVAVIVTGRAPTLGGGGGKLLYRYKSGPESVNRLAKGAAEAQAKIGVHGVSVTTNPLHGRACGVGCRQDIEKFFSVVKTGNDPHHFTVALPNPVTRGVAEQFNALFPAVR